MKSLIVAVSFIGCVFGGVLPPYSPYQQQYQKQVVYGQDQHAQVLRSTSNIDPNGAYEYSFETNNGIQAHESGVGGHSAQGAVHYTAPDGTPIELNYIANENGFQPTGAHIPTPPPVPEAILRSLAWNEAHPEQEQQHVLRYNQVPVVQKPFVYVAPKPQLTLVRQQPLFTPTFKPFVNQYQYKKY